MSNHDKRKKSQKRDAGKWVSKKDFKKFPQKKANYKKAPSNKTKKEKRIDKSKKGFPKMELRKNGAFLKEKEKHWKKEKKPSQILIA